jgi:hypothetical protein
MTKPAAYLDACPEFPTLPPIDFHEHLCSIASPMVAFCEFYRPNIRFFIESLEEKQNALTPNQFRVYVSFVINVIIMSNPVTLYLTFSADWSSLFQPFKYPDGPFELNDAQTFVRDSMNFLLYSLLKKVPDAQLPIAESIAKFVKTNNERVYHFLPLLIQFLRECSQVPFVTFLMKSQLLPIVLNVAEIDSILFDYVKLLASRCATECFLNQDFVNFLCNSFFVPERRASAVTCFSFGLSCSGGERNVLGGIVGIFQKCLSEKHEFVNELFPVIEHSAGGFTAQVSEIACELHLIDSIAETASTFVSIFPSCVNLLALISRQNDVILRYLLQGEDAFYGKLEKGATEGELNLQRAKAILGLAISFRPGRGGQALVRNYHAIELLLSCARRSPAGEKWVTTELIKLASFRPNLREFGNGNIVPMIIDRMDEVQSYDDLRRFYFSLLKGVSEQVLTAVSFDRIWELTRSDSYKYPHEFMQLFIDLLSNGLPTTPSAYFQFDGRETGLVTGTILAGDSFSVCFSFRVDVFEGVSPPLLTINGRETVTIYFKENALWVSAKDIDRPCPTVLEPCQWHFLTLAVSSVGIAVSINCDQVLALSAFVHLGNETSLSVASKSLGSRCLAADVSAIFIFKTCDMKLIKPRLTQATLSPFLKTQVVYCFDPAVLGNPRANLPVKLRAKCMTSVKTIHDFLPSSRGFSALLSFLMRTLTDMESKGFLSLWIRLLQKTLTSSDSGQGLFEPMGGFLILSGFLCRANAQFFEDRIPQDLVNLFEAMTLLSLRTQMADHIWLNFDLVVKFGCQQKVFLSSCLVAYQICPVAFHTVRSYYSLVYQTVYRFSQDSESSNCLWGLVENFLCDKFMEKGFHCLISIAVMNFRPETSQKALSLVKDVTKRLGLTIPEELHPGILELLRTPYLQPLALAIIETIPDLNVRSALLYRATQNISLQDSQKLIPRLRDYLYGANGWMYLPLFVTCELELELPEMQRDGLELSKQISQSPMKFLEFLMVDHWLVYLFQLFTTCKLEKRDFDLAFAKLMDQRIDLNFFGYLASKDDNRWLTSLILGYLLRDGAGSPDRYRALFDVIFSYLFFQFAGTQRLHFVLDVSEDGEWNDIDIAENVLSGFTGGTLRCERAQKVAYLVGQLARFGKYEYLDLVPKIAGDAETVYTATRIAAHMADVKGLTTFQGFEGAFDDDLDSNALQFFLFEARTIQKFPRLRQRFSEAAAGRDKATKAMLERVVADRQRLLYGLSQFQEKQKAKVQADRADRNRAFDSFRRPRSQSTD